MIALIAVLCFSGYALAWDTAGSVTQVTATAPLSLTGWPALVLIGLVVGSYVARRIAPGSHFFHTEAGASVLALIVSICSATAQAIQSKGFSSSVVWTALTGAVLSLTATSNPSVPVGQQAPMARKKESGFVTTGFILIILFTFVTGMAVFGCGVVGNKIANDVSTCAAVQVEKVVIDEINSAINGSAQSWSDEQIKLENNGLDFAICAIEKAIADLANRPPGMTAPRVQDRLEVARATLMGKRNIMKAKK